MPHGSQNSLLLDLPESADIASAGADAQTSAFVAGAYIPGAISLTVGEDLFLVIRYTGTSVDVFVPKDELVINSFEANASADYQTRAPAATAGDLYCGGCKAPAFTIPQCRSVVIINNNAALIYARKGTANRSGLTIAKPGDSGGDDVQGIPIPASTAAAKGMLVLNPGDFEPGDEWHLLGTAGSQTATVNFI